MKVEQLIQILKTHDPNMDVRCWDQYYNFTDVDVFTTNFYDDIQNTTDVVMLQGTEAR